MTHAIGCIVVGTDASEGAERAVAWAAALAGQTGARVVLVRAYNPLDDLGRHREDLQSLEERARNALTERGAAPLVDAGVEHETRLVEGQALDVLSRVVEDVEADLLVVGSHGQTGWKERILGSTATALPHRVDCPVVVVPRARPTAD